MKNDQFHKKVYTRLDPFSLGVDPHSFARPVDEPVKKIISTPKRQSTREDFKKTFLPLLIEVFELRQMIKGHQIRNPLETVTKSPQEIVKQLQLLQNEIEESQKWCEGIILQISKAIDEAKTALAEPGKAKKLTWGQKLRLWIQR
ncbi:MAG: hypothetical protein FJZ56_01130 [Chlamydiae bacterium]|nr:hypothetical protein [Chlamydiota bacterium]